VLGTRFVGGTVTITVLVVVGAGRVRTGAVVGGGVVAGPVVGSDRGSVDGVEAGASVSGTDGATRTGGAVVGSVPGFVVAFNDDDDVEAGPLAATVGAPVERRASPYPSVNPMQTVAAPAATRMRRMIRRSVTGSAQRSAGFLVVGVELLVGTGVVGGSVGGGVGGGVGGVVVGGTVVVDCGHAGKPLVWRPTRWIGTHPCADGPTMKIHWFEVKPWSSWASSPVVQH